ncbi:MAG: succinate dehydrogenase assembly factor 2 [Phaeovulum sp.]|uniref:succinate dehydrogenase assembly factor 2 n=1 Tax=Phaeovulum sp. TaxID=2934796 RepID=UPI002732DBE9|nr:succinate dehydrogenase assembly factor 2 [Phaeovulum sp.]MDP3861195.1 succinate dehydrogenase assembly factor 2 [Phaeovulum sp.]
MTETPEARLKRMTMRSWRRGIKEMDLIFGRWSEAHLAGLDAEKLELYEALLAEADQDIYPWITAAVPVPLRYAALIDEIRVFARANVSAG